MARSMPVIATQSPGNYFTGALWNASVKALGDFYGAVPRFRGYQATAQSLANNTWTNVTLDTEEYDSDNGHSTTVSSSRYTVQVAGTYLIVGSIGIVANATGNRGLRITVNGNAINGSFVKTGSPDSTGSAGLVTAASHVCAVGDYIEIQAHQTSGSALNTNAAGDVACSMTVQWIAG
ncbi:hypothetical protein ACFVY4_26655 [Streptomyces sp. NPDC058299]|uniref:hypothetical protein n=1 Tax=Streptomyces sp. NPDC058299 TaxID=3346435 RepID=UPI0036EF48FA